MSEREMTAAKAIRLQREERMSARDIASELGVTTAQVVGIFRQMRYDPVEAHADELRRLLDEGQTITGALDQLGIGRNSNTWRRMQARGLIPQNAYSRGQGIRVRKQPNRQAKCAECEIVIHPYDADDKEQQAWGNGTRDGVHCIVCEERLRNGGGWIGGLPLYNTEPVPLNLDEVFGIR